MFPRHVRWYRLLLFVLVLILVNCEMAIAKTDSNLESGPGNSITCPADSMFLSLTSPSNVDLDCSEIEDLLIDCNTVIPLGQSLTEYIDAELDQCADIILNASSSTVPGMLSIQNNFLFTGSGVNTDIVYTGFTGSGSNPDAIFITGSGSSQDIIFTVSDINGNSSTCSKSVTIDRSNPSEFSIVCNGSQCAFLEENGLAVIAPENFVVDIVDACNSSGPYIYEIARMVVGPCATNNDLLFENSKTFCCSETDEDVTVFVRVTDSQGNSSTCMTTVEVKDLIAPIITSCPPDLSISCNTTIDLNDLSEYGTANATENCPVGSSAVFSYEDLREDCGLGQIIRTFTFKDASDNIVSCDQVLTVYNDNPFSESSIVWPTDNNYTNLCDDDIPTPAIAGVPTYPISSCNSPLVTHSDDITSTGPGCLIVNRTWVVIDWCQFDGSAPSSTYRWEHTQVITIENNIAPTFTCDSYIEACGNELTCTGMINYSITATDDCTGPDDLVYAYVLTLEDGTIVNGSGNSINSPYPYGEHSLLWSVSDQCGNRSTCAQTIKIKDCKPPTAICLSGVNINLTQIPGMDAQAVIWASDMDASSSDNCTETAALEFAFDPDFTQTSLTFNCGDVGGQSIILYVRDGDGNVGLCKSSIGIQDNHNLCADFVEEEGEVMIAGRVSTQYDLLMEDVDVMLENTNEPMHYMTDNEGEYAFENLPMYENFRLVPTFEDAPVNGISTADILLIQRHILGIQDLDSPYKVIAADINNSSSVTAIDIIELRKIILGTQEEFSNSTVWRFVDSGRVFPDPGHPFPYTQTMNLTQLDHDAMDMNFVGVKTGDVNYSALINGFIPETLSFRSSETLSLVSSSLERGSVQLTVNKEQELSGFQLAFRCSRSLNQLNLTSELIQIDEENFAVDGDLVKISWSSAEAITVKEGDLLFSMNFDDEVDFHLLNDLPTFKTEAYNASINSLSVEINTETEMVNNEWQVYRNTPNPFVDNTFIPFNAPSQSKLTLSVFDLTGRSIFSETKIVEPGYQKWEISASDLGNVHGVLYYRLESDDFSSTQPFIRLK